MMFRHAGTFSCKTLYHCVLHDKNLKARLLTQGLVLFSPGLPGKVFQWHGREYAPHYSGGTVTDLHRVPFAKDLTILC